MLCTSVANAELTTEEWRQNKKFWMPHIVGIATGLQWANNAIELSGQKPLFCIPPKLTINVETLETIIEQAIRSDPLLAKGSFMVWFYSWVFGNVSMRQRKLNVAQYLICNTKEIYRCQSRLLCGYV
jgi:hypothetical protein